MKTKFLIFLSTIFIMSCGSDNTSPEPQNTLPWSCSLENYNHYPYREGNVLGRKFEVIFKYSIKEKIEEDGRSTGLDYLVEFWNGISDVEFNDFSGDLEPDFSDRKWDSGDYEITYKKDSNTITMDYLGNGIDRPWQLVKECK